MNPNKTFTDQLNNKGVFKSSVLSDLDKTEWPDRIDYIASRVARGGYTIGMNSMNPVDLSNGYTLDKAASDFYLEGIAALTDDLARQTALPKHFGLGSLLVEFAELKQGLESVDRRDVPPGEILARMITRTAQRQADGQEADIARQMRTDLETPRELVAELTTVPEVAPLVESAIPDTDNPKSLTTELAALDLTTELWDHQFESLALWLHHGMNGYVDMATATGKTVLGLAAVAHAVDSGSLHPADQERLDGFFEGDTPEPYRNRPDDVLIVTTDDLLGVQWARLFQEHCHTPPAFTKVEETGIQLPWGRIDIRSAGSLGDVDPSEYRLAVFDEVHNYSARSGWGDHLVEFVESPCPVLALTGSATDDLESLVAQVDRPFLPVYRYTHEQALADGVIPDFEWTLTFSEIAASNALSQFRETADYFEELAEYETGTFRLDSDALATSEPELTQQEITQMAGEYGSGAAFADGLRDAGDGSTAPTDTLESLASGVSNRTIHRLNLGADLESVVEITESGLKDNRPVLVLTQSYSEAEEIAETLDDTEGRKIICLDTNQSAKEQDQLIQRFDNAETDEKVLIGPGKRIGQGNDIKSVEVGINIARPGSGVNATLVQRLGRLLRDAGGKDTVDFHHVVGVPPAEATIDPDGESFVRTVAEFFGQVLEPDAEGILKPPAVSIRGVEPDVITLEELGAPHIHKDDQSTIIESAYATAIDEQGGAEPAVNTDWFSAAFGDVAESTAGSGGDGRVKADSAGGKEQDESSDDDDDAGGSGTDATSTDMSGLERSPLAEHYDAFRSLAIIHKSLRESANSDIPSSDPLHQWIVDVKSILTEEGYRNQERGYGKQQADRNPQSMPEYREEFGDADRVTDFEHVTVQHPSQAVLILLDDALAELSSWVVPVAPESELPLPVLVESEAELERARGLLEEFPHEPQVFVDEGDEIEEGHGGGIDEDNDPQESTPTPVEDIRGVMGPVAEALRDAGYDRMIDLQKASDEELVDVENITEQRLALIRAAIGTE